MSFSSIYTKDISCKGEKYTIHSIVEAAKANNVDLDKLPYSLRVLFENCIRFGANNDTLKSFGEWIQNKSSNSEINFMPSRVLMQDFTGVPAVVDLAAMRDAMAKLNGDTSKINPLIPVELVIDHSIQVDYAGDQNSARKNVELEFERNMERYEFLKWGQNAFNNFKVVPPGTGICHQVNLEHLAKVVYTKDVNGRKFAYPDTVVGTDSHTTMINGVGVLGWGVGGIEAEAAMLGQSIPMIIPEVIGVHLKGKINAGVTATDVVLTITEILRKRNVVGKFVEYFGPGAKSLSLADRATIANMGPEYGATCGFFAVDDETIKFLKLTGRDDDLVQLVEAYSKEQKLWADDTHQAVYTDVLELDLATVVPCMAGPKRPQDRVILGNVQSTIEKELLDYLGENYNNKKFELNGERVGNADVVIAAITSCTNTSNPSVLIAAGLLAKKAAVLGLSKKPWVKASLAPGSQVVTEYLKVNGLDTYLDKLGFNLVGYGCTTCIGNSGPLSANIEKLITDNKLLVGAVLSGNRNFEGRVHPLVRANYLASPPLVVAYAIAGTLNINLATDSLGIDANGKEVYLRDIWPSHEEINAIINNSLTKELFNSKYKNVFLGDDLWQKIHTTNSSTYNWNTASTYINNPPYFDDIEVSVSKLQNINAARVLAVFGDSITTDHISPAGNISKNSPAAKYLLANNVEQKDFNSYGSRRGNHEVMMRGTFANIRIKNKLCGNVEGGLTKHIASQELVPIYDAAMMYKTENTPLVVFAGKEYGTGSSRDWAAKGTFLLGIKAVIAESFERIHRSNLVGMGVLPFVFANDFKVTDLDLRGDEEVNISGINNIQDVKSLSKFQCSITRNGALIYNIELKLVIFTDDELSYVKHGSVLHKVVRELK